ncbi:MAG: hypothetical protein RIR26_2924 [Pseudomonadota bacterium]|jgi:hypothetical protein
MPDLYLAQRLKKLCDTPCTLLWLEGSKHERVLSVRLQEKRLILLLSDQTSRVVTFERYTVTAVGLQFWSQGRPGVLYRWEQVPRESWDNNNKTALKTSTQLKNSNNNDKPPPAAA